jgi:uncharacterized MAPEG superfamily protein
MSTRRPLVPSGSRLGFHDMLQQTKFHREATVLHDTVFQIYAVCSSILVLNLLFLASGTALNRAGSGKMLNPEDQKVNPKGVVQTIDEGVAARYRRAHLNALENILPFLPMGFLLVLTAPSMALAATLFGTFTLFRLIHSLAYIKAIQPLRTISFAISSLALVGVMGALLFKVFTA